MKRPRRSLVVLDPAGALAEALEPATAEFAIARAAAWSCVPGALNESSPFAVLLTTDDALPGGPADLQRLLARHPLTAAVLAAPLPRITREWLAAVPHALAEVLVRGHDDTPHGLLLHLRRARRRPIVRLVSGALPATLPGRARALVFAVAEAAAEGAGARELAARIGTSPRSLSRWCSAAGLPPPRRLLALIRLLIAAALLEDARRGVDDVAVACGYSSSTTLGRASVSLAGMTPGALRTRGAVAVVSRAVLRALPVRP